MDRGKEKFYRFGTFVESLKFMTQMHISYSSINRNVKTDYGTVQGRYEPGISILGDCLLIIYDLALGIGRDQIWLVDKGKDLAAKLVPYSDFKTRDERPFRKGYLRGRYGAIPRIAG